MKFLSNRVTVKKMGKRYSIRYKRRTILVFNKKSAAKKQALKIRNQIRNGFPV